MTVAPFLPVQYTRRHVEKSRSKAETTIMLSKIKYHWYLPVQRTFPLFDLNPIQTQFSAIFFQITVQYTSVKKEQNKATYLGKNVRKWWHIVLEM